MTKNEAKSIAIELAKAAMSGDTGNLTVYPDKESSTRVADFIDTLTARLADTNK